MLCGLRHASICSLAAVCTSGQSPNVQAAHDQHVLLLIFLFLVLLLVVVVVWVA